MAILQLGLGVGALSSLYVAWASWSAGYPPEVASVRGVVAFAAVAMVAYVGELIVATAPADQQQAAQGADAALQAAAAPSPAAASRANLEATAGASAGRAAGAGPVGGTAIGAGEQFASLPAGAPIIAPDFGAASVSTQEAEPAGLRTAA